MDIANINEKKNCLHIPNNQFKVIKMKFVLITLHAKIVYQITLTQILIRDLSVLSKYMKIRNFF
jgi:cell division protein FtsL